MARLRVFSHGPPSPATPEAPGSVPPWPGSSTTVTSERGVALRRSNAGRSRR